VEAKEEDFRDQYVVRPSLRSMSVCQLGEFGRRSGARHTVADLFEREKADD
jgi:hypothetical protein